MSLPNLPGGPTKDEVMAVALFKLGLQAGDLMLDIGCGTGKVAIASARTATRVCAIDRRPEAIRYARKEALNEGVMNIDFFCTEATRFLNNDKRIFDCAFIGGSQRLSDVIPLLAGHVRRSIVVNAVLVSTLQTAVETMKEIRIFSEVVHVQIAHSREIAGSIMFRPINPVFVVVGKGTTC
jgi:cobalt-precorrin-6B (C15)-methyltransferase